MSGHTPGPWEADGATTPGGLGRRYHEIFAPEGIAIAHTADRDPNMGTGEDNANALLIAAAPELADALEGLLRRHAAYIKELPGESGLSDLNAAYEALRKAGRLP